MATRQTAERGGELEDLVLKYVSPLIDFYYRETIINDRSLASSERGLKHTHRRNKNGRQEKEGWRDVSQSDFPFTGAANRTQDQQGKGAG